MSRTVAAACSRSSLPWMWRAPCRRSSEPSLRFLMAQLPPFGEGTAQYPSSNGIHHIADCLQWLASRKVSVRAFRLSRLLRFTKLVLGPQSMLSQIETLYWRGDADRYADLTAVLRCLPNLTAIHQESMERAATFDTALTPKLQCLSLTGHSLNEMPPFRGVCPLQELRMKQFDLSADMVNRLASSCPKLQLLEILMVGQAASNVIQLLQVCPCLVELILLHLTASQAEVMEVVASCQNIRRLTLLKYSGARTVGEMFADLLEQTPKLELIKISGFRYSREEGRLELPVNRQEGEISPVL